MRYGVPIAEYIDIDTDDIDFEYRWFDNETDAVAFSRTDDAVSGAIDMIIAVS